MQGEAGRCGEMPGDAGRCREIWVVLERLLEDG